MKKLMLGFLFTFLVGQTQAGLIVAGSAGFIAGDNMKRARIIAISGGALAVLAGNFAIFDIMTGPLPGVLFILGEQDSELEQDLALLFPEIDQPEILTDLAYLVEEQKSSQSQLESGDYLIQLKPEQVQAIFDTTAHDLDNAQVQKIINLLK
jgi:hypothetical protein